MNKKKLFSVVSTGILAFSSGTPSVLASAPFALDLLQGEGEIEISRDTTLADIVETDNEDVERLLANLYVSEDAKGNILLSGLNDTYQVDVSINEEELTIDKGEEFQLVISISDELVESNLTLALSSSTSQVEDIIIPVEALLQLAKDSATYSESLSDLKIIENDEVIEEMTEKEETSEEVEKTPEVVSGEEGSNNELEEAVDENKTESDADETVVSFERSAEVDALLHGEKETEPVFQTFSMQMFTSSSRTHSDGLYTVRSGDTFSAIASSFNLSSAQLREWNKHVSNVNSLSVGTQLAVTRRGVERMLSDADKARLYTGGATPVFSTNQGFIDEIAPRAIAISNQSGEQALWPSLMIAQAAHESAYGRSSLASPPYHNLSGIKGTHNGNSTLMWTWEVFNGNRVDVLAAFRKYPSYDASLQDYANLLRRGLSWDRNYYSGTWRSNTEDVWEVLDKGGLRGYATDPNYFAAIRRIITQFDLTKYDNMSGNPSPEPEPEKDPKPVMNVANSREVSFSAFLRTGYSIDTHPWGMNGFQRLDRTSSFANETVRVIREAQNGAYYLIQRNGELLGWVDHRALDTAPRKMSNAVNTSYDVIVQDGWFSIDSLPWGTNGFFRIGNTTQIRGEQVKVVQETSNGNYKLIEKDGELLGWVDHRSVARAIQVKEVSTSFPVDYMATIANGGFSIDSLPWGMNGFQRIDRTNSHVGTRVRVTQESGAYVLVSINGSPLGWIDRRALSGIPVRQNYSGARSVNYTATLSSGYTIDTLPWGVEGHTRISRTRFYPGETVRVLRQTGSYALVQIRGRNLGWVDRRALER